MYKYNDRACWTTASKRIALLKGTMALLSPFRAVSAARPSMQQHDIKRRLGRIPEYATNIWGTRKGVEALRRFSDGCHDVGTNSDTCFHVKQVMPNKKAQELITRDTFSKKFCGLQKRNWPSASARFCQLRLAA